MTIASNRKVLENLTETNNVLTTELATSNNKLVTALLKITKLTEQLSFLKSGKGKSPSDLPKLYYCHTHDYDYPHHSGNYDKPKERHKKHTTKDKKMGGCTTKYKVKWHNLNKISCLTSNIYSHKSNLSIFDSDCSYHCLGDDSPWNNKPSTSHGVSVSIPTARAWKRPIQPTLTSTIFPLPFQKTVNSHPYFPNSNTKHSFLSDFFWHWLWHQAYLSCDLSPQKPSQNENWHTWYNYKIMDNECTSFSKTWLY